MKNRIFMLFVLAMVFALSFSAVMAQESPFTLRMVRDWGYGNGTDINGRMSLSVKGDQAQIQQVTFFIDGEVMASVTSAPFKLQFDTNNFESGMHRLTAEVKTIAGETYTTNGLVSNFVEKGAANQSTLKILLLVGGIVAVSMGIQFLMQKNANKNPKYDKNGRIQYGVWGAAVCPSCGQPFNRSFLGINLVGVRLERCPHCGRLVAARRASLLEIERANQKTQPEEPQKFVEKPEEDDLDESRFVDL